MRNLKKTACFATVLFCGFLVVLMAERAGAEELYTIPKDTLIGNHLELMKSAGTIFAKGSRGKPLTGFEISFVKKMRDDGFIWFTHSELRDIRAVEAAPGILKFNLSGNPAYVFRQLVKCQDQK